MYWLQLSKDMYDVHEDISFTWICEYHWDVWTVSIHLLILREFHQNCCLISSLVASTGTRRRCRWSYNIPCGIWWIRGTLCSNSHYLYNLSKEDLIAVVSIYQFLSQCSLFLRNLSWGKRGQKKEIRATKLNINRHHQGSLQGEVQKFL